MATDSIRLVKHGVECFLADHGGRQSGCWKQGFFYEEALLEAIFPLADELAEKLVLDVGASIGNHTIWFAKVMGLRTIAFEPLETARLMENLVLNQLNARKVSAFPIALGDHPTVASRKGKGVLALGEGNIFVRELDSLGFGDVGLIKADIEGMEPAFLRGAEQTIRECEPVLFLEAHRGTLLEHSKILVPWGYSIVRKHNVKRGVAPVVEWRVSP